MAEVAPRSGAQLAEARGAPVRAPFGGHVMQEFRADGRNTGDTLDGDVGPDEVPTVKIRVARAVVPPHESSGKHRCATPIPGSTRN